jgi:hypothetical protein
MDASDKFFLGQSWYPYYRSLPPDMAGPSAYKSSGGRSKCARQCEKWSDHVDFVTGDSFHCYNSCINSCTDLSQSKVDYGRVRAQYPPTGCAARCDSV